MAQVRRLAPAKVNLFLHVAPVSDDGYHPLASLVAFADVGDGVTGGVNGGFRAAMADALKDVSKSHFEAGRLQREVTLDNPAVSIEETMVAMQKAQIGFQATLQVRNRLVQAYSDIMNMQV